jgi:predicted metalloprotease with PDZ domain
MKFRLRLCLLAAAVAAVALPLGAQRQTLPPQYVIGVDLAQPKPDCPVFVRHVDPEGPAAKAGVKTGDAVVAIDGVPIQTLADMAKVTRDKPRRVRMEVARSGGKYAYDVDREPFADALERQHRKLAPNGVPVPADMTDAEIERVRNFDPARVVDAVFPNGFPADPEDYFGGFQVLLVQMPDEVLVGPMSDGPATHAGLHLGDVILAVNGAEVKGLTAPQLAQLFTGKRPGRMRVRVRRLDTERLFEFPLWKTSDILAVNQLQVVRGALVPLGVGEKDLACFLETP